VATLKIISMPLPGETEETHNTLLLGKNDLWTKFGTQEVTNRKPEY
jgi:hypothetical protein